LLSNKASWVERDGTTIPHRLGDDVSKLDETMMQGLTHGALGCRGGARIDRPPMMISRMIIGPPQCRQKKLGRSDAGLGSTPEVSVA